MQNKQKYYIDNYQVKALLGRGGQANVYLCYKQHEDTLNNLTPNNLPTNSSSPNQHTKKSYKTNLFAAKVYFPYTQNYTKYYNRQIQSLTKLKHQNIIKIVQHNKNAKVCIQNQEYDTAAVIVMQYATRNRLAEYIGIQGRFQAAICRSLIKKVINTVRFVHENGVTHRDLKMENILFDEVYNLKIIDFGFSKDSIGENGDYVLYTKLGSQGYKSPEILMGRYTGLQADLFAIGVILFYMYTGSPPFTSTKNTDPIYKFICQKKYDKFWSIHTQSHPPFQTKPKSEPQTPPTPLTQPQQQQYFPQSLKKLFQSFFSKSLNERPTFQTLQKDQWLNSAQADQNQIYQQLSRRYVKILENDCYVKEIQDIVGNLQEGMGNQSGCSSQ